MRKKFAFVGALAGLGLFLGLPAQAAFVDVTYNITGSFVNGGLPAGSGAGSLTVRYQAGGTGTATIAHGPASIASGSLSLSVNLVVPGFLQITGQVAGPVDEAGGGPVTGSLSSGGVLALGPTWSIRDPGGYIHCFDIFTPAPGGCVLGFGVPQSLKLTLGSEDLVSVPHSGMATSGGALLPTFTLVGSVPASADVDTLVFQEVSRTFIPDIVVDIKPSSDHNPVNLRGNGLIPVAILGTDTFDVADVDTTTLAFGPAGAAPVHVVGGHPEDVNDDGLTDLVSHYRTQEAGLQVAETEACVSFETLGGTPLEGCDTVSVFACGQGFALAAFVVPPFVWVRRRVRT